MPPVMRETNRIILDGDALVIQCPRVVLAQGGRGFCGGVGRVKPDSPGRCAACGWPMEVRVDPETRRWVAYVGVG